MTAPVFRFAPSPNGLLHPGHARSALLNADLARATGGRFLLRIEDIDRARCTAELEQAIYADLCWLGLEWERPVRRQSDHFPLYQQALDRLKTLGLVYPCRCTRGGIRAAIAETEAASGTAWPRDPDGAPLYPGTCRNHPFTPDDAVAWRLDMTRALARLDAPLTWTEWRPDGTSSPVPADPARWGDVVLARRDTPTSYHLSVVIDDAAQGVTHVVRGMDLFEATAIHRLLQQLLDLPAPLYHHHTLVQDGEGRKLSKSNGATSLRALRARGLTPDDVRALAFA